MLKEIDEKLKEIQILLKKELYEDTLTKAKNRKWFYNVFLKEKYFQSNGYIALIDLNGFKKINDTLGHLEGDRLLKRFVELSKTYFDGEIIRYGGDEFVFISEKDFKLKDIKISYSFGKTEFKKDENFEKIFDIIDKKMYLDKKFKRRKNDKN